VLHKTDFEEEAICQPKAHPQPANASSGVSPPLQKGVGIAQR
jgi:hypothetical protein